MVTNVMECTQTNLVVKLLPRARLVVLIEKEEEEEWYKE